jgi:SRSO17 transposase
MTLEIGLGHEKDGGWRGLHHHATANLPEACPDARAANPPRRIAAT